MTVGTRPLRAIRQSKPIKGRSAEFQPRHQIIRVNRSLPRKMPPSDSEAPQIIAPSLIGSCRLATSFILCLGSFSTSLMMANLSFAIICIHQDDSSDVSWSRSTQGLLLAGGFYGAIASPILTGYLSDKYGRCKLQLLLSVVTVSLADVLSPTIIVHLGDGCYFALRILMGLAATCAQLSILNLVRHWASPRDQGLLVGLSMAGSSIAGALRNPISAAMCHYGGWRSIFYFTGACGLFWLALATLAVYDTPTKHPRVSAEERQYLHLYGLTSKQKNQETEAAIPWSEILTSAPVWSVVVTNFFFLASPEGINLSLPRYFKEVLGLSLAENGLYTALPSVGNSIVYLITGPIFDYVRSRNVMSLSHLRKLFHLVGTLIPAIMMFGLSQIGPNQQYLILPFITIGSSMTEVTLLAGYGTALMDMAPNFLGILYGVSYSIGLTPGAFMPLIIAALTPNGTAEEWGRVYLLSGCLFSISWLVFTFTGDARRQKWARPNPTVIHNP